MFSYNILNISGKTHSKIWMIQMSWLQCKDQKWWCKAKLMKDQKSEKKLKRLKRKVKIFISTIKNIFKPRINVVLTLFINLSQDQSSYL